MNKRAVGEQLLFWNVVIFLISWQGLLLALNDKNGATNVWRTRINTDAKVVQGCVQTSLSKLVKSGVSAVSSRTFQHVQIQASHVIRILASLRLVFVQVLLKYLMSITATGKSSVGFWRNAYCYCQKT